MNHHPKPNDRERKYFVHLNTMPGKFSEDDFDHQSWEETIV
jgi:hypothetical protein